MFSYRILQTESVCAAFCPASLAAGTVAGGLADHIFLEARGGFRGRVCIFAQERPSSTCTLFNVICQTLLEAHQREFGLACSSWLSRPPPSPTTQKAEETNKQINYMSNFFLLSIFTSSLRCKWCTNPTAFVAPSGCCDGSPPGQPCPTPPIPRPGRGLSSPRSLPRG